MSRRRAAVKREVLPDPKFGDIVLTKFMNCLMYQGKKSVAETIVYGAFERVAKRSGADPIRVFHDALGNVKPSVEVRSRRVGGATYQVPVEVPVDRQLSLAMRWLVDLADARKGTAMREALALEIMDAFQGQGNAIRKRDEVHKMAQANKAFAHFRW
jgi:small subunit ribosomal protein S7